MTNAFVVEKTFGEAILEANLFEKESWRKVGYPRFISSIAVVGSAAIADFEVEIWAGQVLKRNYKNTAAGASMMPIAEDRKFDKIFIPKDAEIQCRVVDAAAGNNVIIEIGFAAAKTRRYPARTPQNSNARTYRRTFMPYNQWVAAGRPRG